MGGTLGESKDPGAVQGSTLGQKRILGLLRQLKLLGSVVETPTQFRQQLQRIKVRFPYLTLSMKNANYNTFRLPLLLHVSRTQFWCIFGHISLNLAS